MDVPTQQTIQTPAQPVNSAQTANAEPPKPGISKWLLLLILIAIFIFAGLTFFILNTKNKTQNTNTASTEYTDKINNFSLKHSSEWTAYNLKNQGSQAAVIFSNNKLTINVFVSASTENSLDEWIKAIKEKQGQTADRIVEDRRISLDNAEAQLTVREYQNTGQAEVVAIHKGKVYQIVSPITVNDTRTEVVETLEDFLKTFKFSE